MTHTTKKHSGLRFRSWIMAVAVVLGISFSNIAMATPASALTRGNIYNNSDHGMWFYSGPSGQRKLNWVPAKTWSSAVGVVASGVFNGKGYCANYYKTNGKGGWTLFTQVAGLYDYSVFIPYGSTSEWRVDEWRCS